MKNVLFILALFALSSCGGRGQKKVAGSDAPPPGEYHETITEYENTYNADSLLVKVMEQDYAVVGDMKSPEGTCTYEYDYRTLPDGAIERRKFRIDGARELIAVAVTSPHREETIELNGADTTLYERKLFDGGGRIVSEEERAKMNHPAPGTTIDYRSQTTYEYDRLGREVKKTWRSISENDEISSETITEYRGDTDEIVSQKIFDSRYDTVSTLEYRTQHSGDTLIRKAYSDDRISLITKKAPGYFATIYYEDGQPMTEDEVYTDGDRRIEVCFETFKDGFEEYNLDSIYYHNDLKTRWSFDSSTMRSIHIYEYDSRGNPTRDRQQAWFSSTL